MIGNVGPRGRSVARVKRWRIAGKRFSMEQPKLTRVSSCCSKPLALRLSLAIEEMVNIKCVGFQVTQQQPRPKMVLQTGAGRSAHEKQLSSSKHASGNLPSDRAANSINTTGPHPAIGSQRTVVNGEHSAASTAEAPSDATARKPSKGGTHATFSQLPAACDLNELSTPSEPEAGAAARKKSARTKESHRLMTVSAQAAQSSKRSREAKGNTVHQRSAMSSAAQKTVKQNAAAAGTRSRPGDCKQPFVSLY